MSRSYGLEEVEARLGIFLAEVFPDHAGVAELHRPELMEGIAVSSRGLRSSTSPKLFRPCKLPSWVRRGQWSNGLQQVRVLAMAVRASGKNVRHCHRYKEAASTSIIGAWDSILSSMALRSSSQEISLSEGHWVKLICGASFEDVAEVRNLSLVYTLAGVDCIDCAADTAVIAAVAEGVNAAQELLKNVGSPRRPWIMISVNDDVDPHFRKAEFNSEYCPSDCPRPCERACPALAIKFQEPNNAPGVITTPLDGGVIMERCYGCGRCLPVCPMGLISARTYVRPFAAVANLLLSAEVDAIEIHTGAGHLEAFRSLVAQLGSTLSSLKLVAVRSSKPVTSLKNVVDKQSGSLEIHFDSLLGDKLDGRPMSGDIGAGATRATVALAARVAASANRPHGYLQLAGGTNAHTVTAMKKKGLCGPSPLSKPDDREVTSTLTSSRHFHVRSTGEALIAGVAYGGYARKVVSGFLQKMQGEWDGDDPNPRMYDSSLLENYPSLLLGALQEAIVLVDTVKNADKLLTVLL